ncbi:MAG: diacylglycerol kinase family protein [bacterium]
MSARKILRHIFRFRGLLESMKFALNGIAYLFIYHRNMRIIFLCGLFTFIMGMYFKLNRAELVALSVTITIVFMAEIFNTAIEMMMDMVKVKYHTLIKLIKDIAAAVVLLASLNAIAVGYILFAKKIFK